MLPSLRLLGLLALLLLSLLWLWLLLDRLFGAIFFLGSWLLFDWLLLDWLFFGLFRLLTLSLSSSLLSLASIKIVLAVRVVWLVSLAGTGLGSSSVGWSVVSSFISAKASLIGTLWVSWAVEPSWSEKLLRLCNLTEWLLHRSELRLLLGLLPFCSLRLSRSLTCLWVDACRFRVARPFLSNNCESTLVVLLLVHLGQVCVIWEICLVKLVRFFTFSGPSAR